MSKLDASPVLSFNLLFFAWRRVIQSLALGGNLVKHNCTFLAKYLHLIAFLNADLLQELRGNLDAKAAVKPLDNMQTRHGNASFAECVQLGHIFLDRKSVV